MEPRAGNRECEVPQPTLRGAPRHAGKKPYAGTAKIASTIKVVLNMVNALRYFFGLCQTCWSEPLFHLRLRPGNRGGPKHKEGCQHKERTGTSHRNHPKTMLPRNNPQDQSQDLREKSEPAEEQSNDIR